MVAAAFTNPFTKDQTFGRFIDSENLPLFEIPNTFKISFTFSDNQYRIDGTEFGLKNIELLYVLNMNFGCCYYTSQLTFKVRLSLKQW